MLATVGWIVADFLKLPGKSIDRAGVVGQGGWLID